MTASAGMPFWEGYASAGPPHATKARLFASDGTTVLLEVVDAGPFTFNKDVVAPNLPVDVAAQIALGGFTT